MGSRLEKTHFVWVHLSLVSFVPRREWKGSRNGELAKKRLKIGDGPSWARRGEKLGQNPTRNQEMAKKSIKKKTYWNKPFEPEYTSRT